MAVTHFENAHDYFAGNEAHAPIAKSVSTLPVEIGYNESATFDRVMYGVISTGVVGVLTFVLGWQIAGILAVALVLKGICIKQQSRTNG